MPENTKSSLACDRGFLLSQPTSEEKKWTQPWNEALRMEEYVVNTYNFTILNYCVALANKYATLRYSSRVFLVKEESEEINRAQTPWSSCSLHAAAVLKWLICTCQWLQKLVLGKRSIQEICIITLFWSSLGLICKNTHRFHLKSGLFPPLRACWGTPGETVRAPDLILATTPKQKERFGGE